MSNYNPEIQSLNSLKSMFDLGNTPFVPNQHIHNLRFINQENSNSRYRNLLRKGFGNQLFNINRQYRADVSFNSTIYKDVNVNENILISQFNKAKIIYSLSDSSFSSISSISHPDITNIIINYDGEMLDIQTNNVHITKNIITFSNDTGQYDSGLTPFRKAFNAGDIFCTNNSSTSIDLSPPPNQVNSIKSMFISKNKAGSVSRKENGSFFTGNPKYVYDGSDYTKFKKLQSINNNYNDYSFGGDKNKGSQQSYRRVVH